MSRISRQEYLMRYARLAAERSTCQRLQVGAILVRGGRVVMSGYNGAPAGMPHCDPKVCRLDKPCIRTVHAEANCIAWAAREGIVTLGAGMFTTDSPCMTCAQLLINAGISSLVYEREYRDTSPITLMEAAGIQVVPFEAIPRA